MGEEQATPTERIEAMCDNCTQAALICDKREDPTKPWRAYYLFVLPNGAASVEAQGDHCATPHEAIDSLEEKLNEPVGEEE